jgi:DNA-binding response OmpR family regulator
MSERIQVLVVEDDPLFVELLQETLLAAGRPGYALESVALLGEAAARLSRGGIDLVLLDLGLPDSSGLDTFRHVQRAAPAVPIIVLTANSDEETAIAAVKEGAQDYLVKGQFTSHVLVRAARYALERKRAEEALRRQAEELLQARSKELTRLSQASVARELRMIELKREVNELCRQLGQPPRYGLESTDTEFKAQP